METALVVGFFAIAVLIVCMRILLAIKKRVPTYLFTTVRYAIIIEAVAATIYYVTRDIQITITMTLITLMILTTIALVTAYRTIAKSKHYKCKRCKGTTLNCEVCDNPSCPNQPCCGQPKNICDCYDNG